MNSKMFYLAAVITILFIGVLWLGGKPVMSQAVPSDFSYEAPLGPVTFSHKVHVAEKKLQCPDCHMKIFQMKKMTAASQMKMAKLNEGEFCGKCHNGEKAFTTKDSNACPRCHVKK